MSLLMSKLVDANNIGPTLLPKYCYQQLYRHDVFNSIANICCHYYTTVTTTTAITVANSGANP